ncbi:hypothetical protein ACFQFH_01535 [Halobaculum halobium]|uniref:hypothetical protein n=1 Tax=Halobaculum halobium TaxID=3032281 RepID=UPI00361F25AD
MRHHKQTGENGTQNEHGLYRTDTGRVVACDGGRTEDGIDSDVDVDSNDGRTSENGVLTRRGALKMGAAAVAAATGATAATGVGAAATERHGISFSTVVNAVDDLGMDPNGNRAIDGKLQTPSTAGTCSSSSRRASTSSTSSTAAASITGECEGLATHPMTCAS